MHDGMMALGVQEEIELVLVFEMQNVNLVQGEIVMALHVVGEAEK